MHWFLSLFRAFRTTSEAVMVGTLSTHPQERSHVFLKHLPHVLRYVASSSNRRIMRCTDATGGLKLHFRMKDATTELAGTLDPVLTFVSISSLIKLCTKNKSICTGSDRPDSVSFSEPVHVWCTGLVIVAIPRPSFHRASQRCG